MITYISWTTQSANEQKPKYEHNELAMEKLNSDESFEKSQDYGLTRELWWNFWSLSPRLVNIAKCRNQKIDLTFEKSWRMAQR